MILLLFVTIVFTLLGTFKLNTYEGLDEDDSVPSCPSNLEDLDEDNGSWKIKTSLVPPVCPSGPYFNYTEKHDKKEDKKEDKKDEKKDDKKENDSNKGFWNGFINIGNKCKGDDSSSNTEITQNSDYYNKQIQETNLTNNSDNSVRQNTNTSQNVNMDNSVNQDMSQTETSSADSKFNNLLGNNSIMLGSFGGGGQNSTTANNNNAATNGGALAVSTPAPAGTTATAPYQESNPQTISMINDLKGSVAKLNQQKQDDKTGQCPPCPACERCPEPAFECKKVPNYRSPSIDNYMPVPVLNDFSRF